MGIDSVIRLQLNLKTLVAGDDHAVAVPNVSLVALADRHPETVAPELRHRKRGKKVRLFGRICGRSLVILGGTALHYPPRLRRF